MNYSWPPPRGKGHSEGKKDFLKEKGKKSRKIQSSGEAHDYYSKTVLPLRGEKVWPQSKLREIRPKKKASESKRVSFRDGSWLESKNALFERGGGGGKGKVQEVKKGGQRGENGRFGGGGRHPMFIRNSLSAN